MFEFMLMLGGFAVIAILVAAQSRNRHVSLVAWGIIALVAAALIGVFWIIDSVGAQDVPVIVQADPVVIPGGQPEVWYLQWFIEDVQQHGFTEAVKIALGYGRNQDGWFEAVLVFELKYTRTDAERITRDLYAILFGYPVPIGSRWSY